MVVKIVTDSTADLPPQLAAELGITVVPAYVHFGDKAYRDRVEISDEDFYWRLLSGPDYPYTAPPTPFDFANAYETLSSDAEGIISIHISGKLSATCNSAARAKELVKTKIPIQVIDSQLVTMGLGLLVIGAASCAASGDMPSIVAKVKDIIPRVRIVGMFDTLKYLARGGRIGRAKALLGSVLNVKPMMTMRDGELEPAGRVSSRSSGLEKLLKVVRSGADIEDIAVIYSTTPDEANELAGRINKVIAAPKARVARLGPALGVHGGPGIMFVAFRTK